MISITGIYQKGAVVLDAPVNLPEGAHVRVTLDARPGTGVDDDLCLDGNPWPTTPEGNRKWLEWFDGLEPVFSDEEYAQFQATLRAMRTEQAPFLEKRAQMIAALFL